MTYKELREENERQAIQIQTLMKQLTDTCQRLAEITRLYHNRESVMNQMAHEILSLKADMFDKLRDQEY